MADHAPIKKVKHGEPRKDAQGREFAGETTLSEAAGGPRVLGPAQRPGANPPRPPRPPTSAAPPSAKRAPDPAVPGSQYYTDPGKQDAGVRRGLPAFGRDGDKDSDADELTVDEDLGALTRRKDKERAFLNPPEDDPAPGHASMGGGAHRDLDAEARPRDLEHGSPDIHGRRRRIGP